MMTGLPVITTPNSGTLVRDGIEGFVAAYDYLRGEDRTFAVHRITGVAPVEEGD